MANWDETSGDSGSFGGFGEAGGLVSSEDDEVAYAWGLADGLVLWGHRTERIVPQYLHLTNYGEVHGSVDGSDWWRLESDTRVYGMQGLEPTDGTGDLPSIPGAVSLPPRDVAERVRHGVAYITRFSSEPRVLCHIETDWLAGITLVEIPAWSADPVPDLLVWASDRAVRVIVAGDEVGT